METVYGFGIYHEGDSFVGTNAHYLYKSIERVAKQIMIYIDGNEHYPTGLLKPRDLSIIKQELEMKDSAEFCRHPIDNDEGNEIIYYITKHTLVDDSVPLNRRHDGTPIYDLNI